MKQSQKPAKSFAQRTMTPSATENEINPTIKTVGAITGHQKYEAIAEASEKLRTPNNDPHSDRKRDKSYN